MLSTVDVIAEKEVIGCRREAAHLEETDEIGVLAMDIADDFDGRGELEQRGLAEEDLARGLAEGGDFGILETDGLVSLGLTAMKVLDEAW